MAVAALAALPACDSTWVCDSTTCSDGCCTLDGVCAVPNASVGQPLDKCGLNGNRCVDCSVTPGNICDQGTCTPKCGPANCKDGCCNANRECVRGAGQTHDTCGTSGAACAACSIAENCEAQVCKPKCSAANCPSGCCFTDGTCIPYASQNGAACGTGGAACADCSGLSCAQGACCLTFTQSCSLSGGPTCCSPRSCSAISGKCQ